MKQLFKRLCEVMNLPHDEQTAKIQNKTHYLYLDFSSYYGGYRIVNVAVDTGAHCEAFGNSDICRRVPKKQIEQFMLGLIAGHEQAKIKIQ